jgi:hypothetical protein
MVPRKPLVRGPNEPLTPLINLCTQTPYNYFRENLYARGLSGVANWQLALRLSIAGTLRSALGERRGQAWGGTKGGTKAGAFGARPFFENLVAVRLEEALLVR